MKTFEHTPFNDIFVPYIATPELPKNDRTVQLLEVLSYTRRLPFLTRWIIYRAFVGWR